MRLGEARKRAVQWVEERIAGLPGFAGAYFAGSSIVAPDSMEWPSTSDLDVMTVWEGQCPAKPGKFIYNEALLEISIIEKGELESLERILSTHYLAYNLHRDTVIADPTGWLGKTQRQVAENFPREEWVRRRCDAILENLLGDVQHVEPSMPLHELAIQWVFPIGKMSHVLLAAGLQNCTVRARYTRLRELLAPLKLEFLCEELLEPMGAAGLTRQELLPHMEELSETFALACEYMHSPCFTGGDIGPDTRSISIGGTRELVLGPHPQDALFWMVATFGRCHKILAQDAPEIHQKRLPSFRGFLAELGIKSEEALLESIRRLPELVPRVREMEELVLAATPGIVRD